MGCGPLRAQGRLGAPPAIDHLVAGNCHQPGRRDVIRPPFGERQRSGLEYLAGDVLSVGSPEPRHGVAVDKLDVGAIDDFEGTQRTTSPTNCASPAQHNDTSGDSRKAPQRRSSSSCWAPSSKTLTASAGVCSANSPESTPRDEGRIA
jgi:hypothetical protein